jgi:hypothetical protein
MNLDRAIERTSLVRGPKSAARLYNDIEYELALGEPDDHLETIGEQALVLLEERFPGVRQAALEIEQPPSLSRRASDALRDMSPIALPSRPARRPNHYDRGCVRRSRSRLFAGARAHPVATIATVTVLTFVIVHFWAYITLAVIAIVALKASHARQR